MARIQCKKYTKIPLLIRKKPKKKQKTLTNKSKAMGLSHEGSRQFTKVSVTPKVGGACKQAWGQGNKVRIHEIYLVDGINNKNMPEICECTLIYSMYSHIEIL